MNVRFCASCRSLILTDFRYCPYCGEAAVPGPDLAQALDASFTRIERGGKAGPFAAAEERLARLEADMDLILAEIGKGAGN